MAVPKKGTRKITVEGEDYRWLVNVDADYWVKFLVIESSRDNRYQVSASFEYDPDLMITPAIVRQVIQQAWGQGWQPGVSLKRNMNIDVSALVLNNQPESL